MKILQCDVGDCLFYFALTVFVSLTFAANIPLLVGILSPLSYMALLLLAMSLLFKVKYFRSTTLLAIAGLSAIGLYQLVALGNSSLLKLIMLVSATRDNSLKDIIRYDRNLRVFWTILLFAFLNVGITEDVVLLDASRGARHSLGFASPNQFGMTFLIIVLEDLYLKDFRIKFRSVITLFAAIVLVDQITGSRSAALFSMIGLLLAVVNTAVKGHFLRSAFVKNAACLVAPGLFLLTIITSSLYEMKVPWTIALNDVLTNRLWHIQKFYELYRPSLLGLDLSTAGLTLDTLYSYLIFGYGIIIAIIYISSSPFLVTALWNKREYALIAIWIVLSIYGLSERLWVCAEYNGLMLMFAVLLHRDSGYPKITNKQDK